MSKLNSKIFKSKMTESKKSAESVPGLPSGPVLEKLHRYIYSLLTNILQGNPIGQTNQLSAETLGSGKYGLEG